MCQRPYIRFIGWRLEYCIDFRLEKTPPRDMHSAINRWHFNRKTFTHIRWFGALSIGQNLSCIVLQQWFISTQRVQHHLYAYALKTVFLHALPFTLPLLPKNINIFITETFYWLLTDKNRSFVCYKGDKTLPLFIIPRPLIISVAGP